MNKESNNVLYKVMIAVLILIILILGFLFIKDKNNSNNVDSNVTYSNSDLENENKTLKEEKTKLLSEIETLNKNIETLEGKVEDLSKTDKTDNSTEISNLKQEITTLKNQVSTLKSSVETLSSSNTTLKNDKQQLLSEINSYKESVITLNTTITELNDKLASLTGDKKQLTSTINTLNTTISDLNTRITTLINEKTQLQNQLKEEQETYTVFYSIDNKTVYSERVKKGGNVKNVPSIPVKGNYKSEWDNNGKNIQSDMVIYANYYYILTFKRTTETDDDEILTLSASSYKLYEKDSKILNISLDGITHNSKTIVSVNIIDSMYHGYSWVNEDDVSYADQIEVNDNLTFIYDAYYACVAKGSKISMADGTQKNVENIKAGDEVLSYNFYNGTIDSTKVLTILPGKNIGTVFTVKLENGNKLEIVDFENLFDTDAKKYIPINIHTYQDAIGKNVMINDNGTIGTSKIISIDLEEKEVEHYTMYTEKTINYIANNIVALIPVYFANIRYTIGDDYKIDMSKYNEDVQKYGVYTYDDLKDVCTKDTFDKFVLKDFKAVVEKGYITFEEFKQGIKELQDELDFYNSIQN